MSKYNMLWTCLVAKTYYITVSRTRRKQQNNPDTFVSRTGYQRRSDAGGRFERGAWTALSCRNFSDVLRIRFTTAILRLTRLFLSWKRTVTLKPQQQASVALCAMSVYQTVS